MSFGCLRDVILADYVYRVVYAQSDRSVSNATDVHLHILVYTYMRAYVLHIHSDGDILLSVVMVQCHNTELSATLKPRAWLRHTLLIPFNQEVGRVWKHELTSHTYHICTCCIVVVTRFTYYVEHVLLYTQVDCH